MFFTSYEFLLIKRFLFSKKTDGFISIFSWISIIGITIGVAAVIIVMSVMNGFREELTDRLLGINGHLKIYSTNNEITSNEFKLINDKQLKEIIISPSTQTQGLIISNESSKGVVLRGYNNKYLDKNHFLKNKITEGRIFENNLHDVVIGYALANQLRMKINDKIKIAIPKSDNTIFGNIPRFKTLKIVGIFNLGMYEYDSNFIFTHQSIANKLLLLKDDHHNQVEFFVKNPEIIEDTQNLIDNIINENKLPFYTYSWKQNNSAIINALNVEKNVMFLILTLIIIVASMNIISGLIIFVKEKNKDISILKTIGLNNKSLIKIFLTIGFTIGLIGTFLGGILGVIFSLNIHSIQKIIEGVFNTNLFSKEVYYLSNLPSKINNNEIILILMISIFISLLATTIPTFRSIKVDPIKSLKND